MTDLYTTLSNLMAPHLTPTAILGRVMARKFVKLGYVYRDNLGLVAERIQVQLEDLTKNGDLFELWKKDNLKVTLDDDVVTIDYIGQIVDVILNISEADFEIEQQQIEEAIIETTDHVITFLSDKLASAWQRAKNREVKRTKKDRKEFSSIIYGRWGDGLDEFDALIDLCTTLGSQFNSDFRAEAERKQDYKFEALTRVHAWACKVAREIHLLLSNGFADGAYARWRTLEEISIIGEFLRNNDQATSERFLLHSRVEECTLMELWQKDAINLGWPKISSRNLSAAKTRAATLEKRFGAGFGSDYGWAEDALKIKKPKFKDLQDAVSRASGNSFYRRAHKHVHASSYGALFPLGAWPFKDVLVAGGSIYGLSEPAKYAAQAMCSITATVLFSRNGDRFEEIVTLKALMPFRDKVWEAFDKAEDEIRAESKASRKLKIRLLKGAKIIF